ncbi:MAG: putative Glycosyl transferase family 2-containing domain [Micavibrio sp.]|nr:putative Glycosyl transferase family 2-containing domain [Micavibrio sp.]
MSVSFVIPVYNKARYLGLVLNSIAAQKGNFEREFIFVDDGSTDNSLQMVRDLTAGWTNVTIIEQENGGSAKATNTGIAAARMEFIKFVDADDLLHEQATAILLGALKANPGACLAYALCQYFNEGETMDLTQTLGVCEIETIAEPLYASIQNSLFNPTQFLARTDAIKKSGGCDERVKHSQEYSLTLRLARLGSFVKVNETLAFLCRGEAGRHGASSSRQLQRVSLALAYFLEDYPDTPLPLHRHAYKRAIGRAAKFDYRHRGGAKYSKLFWKSLLARIVPEKNYAAAIRATLPVFDERAG